WPRWQSLWNGASPELTAFPDARRGLVIIAVRMDQPRSTTLQIALATFAILTLELALIRWTSQQVRVFAYFNNLTLIAAFLGMGLGVAVGARRPNLQHWTLPTLAVLSILLGLSERLHIVYLQFPDLS